MNERVRRIIADNLYGQIYYVENKIDTYCQWIIDSMCTNFEDEEEGN